MSSSEQRVVIYIDGGNFYFSMKNTFKCKIDIDKFCKKLVGEQDLVAIKYYISPVGESNPEAYLEQQKFFERLRKIEKLQIILGRLEKRKREGGIYYVEKATDVNLALDLVLDAQADVYDKAYLVSNDGDFSEAVGSAIKRFDKEVIYVAIGNRKSVSYHLKKVSSDILKITKEFLKEIIIE